MDYELYVDDDLLARLSPDAAKLAQLMSDISEECYCAGWCMGTEYRLWMALADPTDHRHWGQDIITQEAIDHLRMLSERIGGWIRYVEKVGESFVPMAEWLELYAAELQRNPIRRSAP